jgi:hypothetical protein
MSFTSRQRTTDGRESVAVFDDPNSSLPTDRYVYDAHGVLIEHNGCTVPKPGEPTESPGIGKVAVRN